MRILPAALVLSVAAGPAIAQAPPAPAAAPSPAATPAPAPIPGLTDAPKGPDTVKEMVERELQPAPDGYTYNPQGRRDPFVSLQRGPLEGTAKQGPRPPGIAGFLVQEVALRGIVRDPKGFIGMLLGPDGKSYFVRVGQRLYDGVITAIDATTVTFRQEVTDPLSVQKQRDVKKSLYASEEARQ